jgi:predicted PurR-regulated permease PerM
MMDNEKLHPFILMFTLVVASALFVALGFTIEAVLSPFVLLGAIVFLLYPFREIILVGRILWLAVLLFVLWLLYSLIGILLPFLIALMLAYMFDPLVSKIAGTSRPRWLASLIATVGVFGIGLAVALVLVPTAAEQFGSLMTGLGELASRVVEIVSSGKLFELLAQFGVPVEQTRQMILEQVSPRLQDILGALFQGLFGFLTGFSSVILHVINAVIVPFLFFYLSKDLHTIKSAILDFFPERIGMRAGNILGTVDDILGQYLRGAIIVAIIQGTLSGIVLALIGVRYPLVLGIMTAVLNFIPYVGLITSLVVSCIVTLFSGEPILTKLLCVVVLYLSQKLLEATVLGPKIVGSRVGLHPIVLILSLLVFGYFLGFIGMLIAVPATALILSFAREWRQTRRLREQVAGGVEV